MNIANSLISDTVLSNLLVNQQKNEQHFDTKIKKQNGVFFTNNFDTIDEILSVIDFENIAQKKILEPACGQGIFITKLLDKIYQINQSQDFINDFIANSLIFNDINAEMVEITKENIQKLYFSWFGDTYKGNFQAYISDFTLRNKSNETALFVTQNNIILEKFYNQIDYIVGNPPYVSLYGRRDKKQNEQQRIDYLQNYNQFPAHLKNGKINLVMLFLEHSLDFLKENAQLSFIIDISFFETAYQHTRKFLLENTFIEKIIINITDFEVASGQIILQISKKTNAKNQDKLNNNFTIILDKKTAQTHQIDQKTWQNPKDEYKFRLNTCEVSNEIIDKIKSKKDKTILQIYPNKNLRTCAMLLDMENEFTQKSPSPLGEGFGVRSNENDLLFPYYQGSKSLTEKYGALKFEKIFHYNKKLQDKINDNLKIELEKKGIKNKKRIGLGEKIIYQNPKIFIRQSAKELIASLDYQKSSANNSLYIFSLRDNSENSIFTLKYICAWLNSDLMTFFAQKQNIIRFSKGKQPQIKIVDLGTIPLPDDKILQEKIVFFATKIIDFQGDKTFYQQKINHLIYEYYHFEDKEIAFIEQNIKDF